MRTIFDNYIENSFDSSRQADFKLAHFEFNYRQHFPEAGSQVLDIGVGRGEMLSCMSNWQMDYEGVDISPSTVRFCQSLELNCQLIDDTPSWLKERAGRYAMITVLDVLEHIPADSLVDFAAAVHAGLRPGGRAIFQVPNLQAPFGWLHHFNDITHVHGFVEHSLKQVLHSAGFSNLQFHGFEEIVGGRFRDYCHKGARRAFWSLTRFLRAVNTSPNPKLLHPVFYCLAEKKNVVNKKNNRDLCN